ncbi:MAG: hypothetical protein GTO41_01295 [Burkholderiales bacterium]|nr:hypothetical protein [Burkholderiales bacterium]
MLHTRTVSLALGLTFAISFLVCVLWGLLLPEPMHMHRFLELVLPGFRWISIGSTVLGLVESFLFGVYFGVLYAPIHNWLSRNTTTQ